MEFHTGETTAASTLASASMATSTMPNVEHLLQHYKVADVLHIQRRLKGDVEKRKADLKALIGERYNELLEATDSIEQMSGSVGSLIVSLKELGDVMGSCTLSEDASMRRLKKAKKTEEVQNNSRTDETEYSEAVWNALEQGRITYATYSYFYGLFLYRKLREQRQQQSGQHYHHQPHHRLHFYNQRALEDLSGHIVEHCWRRLATEQQSASSEVDLSTFADTFSCIYLLEAAAASRHERQPRTSSDISRLVEEFYRRQTANIIGVCSQQVPSLSTLLETLLNVITNTVKCSRVFYASEDDDVEESSSALLPQRFHRLVTATYGSFTTTTSRANSIALTKDNSRHQLLHHLQQYQIATDEASSAGTPPQLQLCPKGADSIGAWVASITAQLTATLQQKVEAPSFDSIRSLYAELEATEERLLSGASFLEWEEEFGGTVDVRSTVWTAAIRRAVFERRVQALAAARSAEAVQAVEERLLMVEATTSFGSESTSEAPLSTSSTSNFGDLVWRGSASQSTTTTTNSSLQTLDVAPLKKESGGSSHFLADLLTTHLFTAFLADLQQRVNRLHLSSTTSNQWLLFGALLFERLSVDQQETPHFRQQQQQLKGQNSSPSSYRKLFEDLIQQQQQQQQSTSSWTTVQAELHRISDSYFCRWFELVVGGHLATFTPEALVELTAFLGNLTAWQRVPIAVPTTISLCLQALLESVCGDINRQSGYRLSAPVLRYIVSLLSDQLLAVYEVAIKGRLLGEGKGEAEGHPCPSDYPPAAKQTIAVQLYFDLLFLRSCFSSSTGPELHKSSSQQQQQLKRLNELKALLEGGSGGNLIDPFDLHLMFPALVANAERHLRASSVLFAFLFSASSTTTTTSSITNKTTTTTETASTAAAVRHNIMLVVPPQQQ
ncbi:Golgi transport complex subunit 1 [Tyrophagus putrescentiae]|nr:Golgi transport complex subunit 1 [Tyrophagus putrescentiae]